MNGVNRWNRYKRIKWGRRRFKADYCHVPSGDVSMLIQALYNIVDSYFVAQISESALTAVSLAFPIQTLMIAVGVGTGVGINSLVARRLGEKRQADADCAASHGLLLGVFNWILFALFGIFFTKMFFGAFTDIEEIITMGTQYTSIVTICSFGLMIEVNMEKTLQATGNMIYPMAFQLVGAVTNIILDPVFIFGFAFIPAMGVSGAAIATVIGQILAMLVSLFVIIFKDHAVNINFRRFNLIGALLKKIYAVGFPGIDHASHWLCDGSGNERDSVHLPAECGDRRGLLWRLL